MAYFVLNSILENERRVGEDMREIKEIKDELKEKRTKVKDLDVSMKILRFKYSAIDIDHIG